MTGKSYWFLLWFLISDSLHGVIVSELGGINLFVRKIHSLIEVVGDFFLGYIWDSFWKVFQVIQQLTTFLNFSREQIYPIYSLTDLMTNLLRGFRAYRGFRHHFLYWWRGWLRSLLSFNASHRDNANCICGESPIFLVHYHVMSGWNNWHFWGPKWYTTTFTQGMRSNDVWVAWI